MAGGTAVTPVMTALYTILLPAVIANGDSDIAEFSRGFVSSQAFTAGLNSSRKRSK